MISERQLDANRWSYSDSNLSVPHCPILGMGLFRKIPFHPISTPRFQIPQPLHVGRTVLPSALNQHCQPERGMQSAAPPASAEIRPSASNDVAETQSELPQPMKNHRTTQNQNRLFPSLAQKSPRISRNRFFITVRSRAIKKIRPFETKNLSRHPACLPKAAWYPSDRGGP